MTFEQIIQVILLHEGGYVNHPADKGGETKYGITKRSYPYLNIKTLTKEQAIDIYRRDFWNARKLDSYPSAIRLMVFDMIVNMGSTGSGKVLQRALNRMGYDFEGSGTVGPKTMAAVKEVNSIALLYWMGIERINYYNAIVIRTHSQVVFLKGWTARAIDILERSFAKGITILSVKKIIKSVPAKWAA